MAQQETQPFLSGRFFFFIRHIQQLGSLPLTLARIHPLPDRHNEFNGVQELLVFAWSSRSCGRGFLVGPRFGVSRFGSLFRWCLYHAWWFQHGGGRCVAWEGQGQFHLYLNHRGVQILYEFFNDSLFIQHTVQYSIVVCCLYGQKFSLALALHNCGTRARKKRGDDESTQTAKKKTSTRTSSIFEYLLPNTRWAGINN